MKTLADLAPLLFAAVLTLVFAQWAGNEAVRLLGGIL